MSTEPDFLNIDLPVPFEGIPQDVIEANPMYQKLVAAYDALEPEQQEYVRALPAADYVARTALRHLQERGVKLSERTVYRWMTDEKVKLAVGLQRELASNFAGVDPVAVMLRVVRWLDYSEELVAVTDNNGAVIFDKDGQQRMRKRDPATAIKCLEMLGRHTKAIGGDEAPRTQAPAGGGLHITFIHGQMPAAVRVGQVIDAEIVTPNVEISK